MGRQLDEFDDLMSQSPAARTEPKGKGGKNTRGRKKEMSKEVQKKPLVAKLAAPLIWGTRETSYAVTALSDFVQTVTDPRAKSGAKVARKKWEDKTAAQRFLDVLALGFIFFGTNTAYIQLHQMNGARAPETVSFFPHPGVSAYNLSRVAPPLGNTLESGANIIVTRLPWSNRRYKLEMFEARVTVYSDPVFYLAFILVLAVQLVEAMALRKISLTVKRKEFEELNSQEKVTADPDALRAAKVKANGINNYGMGNILMQGTSITAVYALEGMIYFFSVQGATTKIPILAILGLIEVFGAEFCWGLSERIEDR